MTIRVVQGADGGWQGLYVNGTLLHQGDEIPARVWLDLLKQDPYDSTETIPQDAMDEMGELPTDYKDIQREATTQRGPVDRNKLNERYRG